MERCLVSIFQLITKIHIKNTVGGSHKWHAEEFVNDIVQKLRGIKLELKDVHHVMFIWNMMETNVLVVELFSEANEKQSKIQVFRNVIYCKKIMI